MRLKITLFLLFSSFSFLLQAQDYILNPSFENIFHENNKLKKEAIHKKRSAKITAFDKNTSEILYWYSGLSKIDAYVFYHKIATDKDYYYFNPPYVGCALLSLHDNFLLYTPLARPLKKGKRYRLEYYLSKRLKINSAAVYFYMDIKLSKNRPELTKNNTYQVIKNKVPHDQIHAVGAIEYKEKGSIIHPRPDLWQKFSLEFTAEDDFEYLALERNVPHPAGFREFMYLDNIQLFALDSIKEEEQISIEQEKLTSLAQQIQFETASTKLTQEAQKALDSLATYLEKIPTTSFIQIAGHTDNQGQKAANLRLSKARAEAVKQYLINKNIKAEQLKTAGFGDTKPITTNDSPENRATNRRVEIEYMEQLDNE